MEIRTTMPEAPLAPDRVPGDPLFAIGMLSADVTAVLTRDGALHGCVVCLGSTMDFWSPATMLADGDPRAVAQWAAVPVAGMHPRCIPSLILQWAFMIHGVDEFDEHLDDDFEVAHAARAAAVKASASADAGAARRSGAYGRRGNQ